MPYGIGLKDERPKSNEKMNVQHRTSNVQHRMKKQTSNTEHSTPIPAFFSRFDTRNKNSN